jgi:hypothetical protein
MLLQAHWQWHMALLGYWIKIKSESEKADWVLGRNADEAALCECVNVAGSDPTYLFPNPRRKPYS